MGREAEGNRMRLQGKTDLPRIGPRAQSCCSHDAAPPALLAAALALAAFSCAATAGAQSAPAKATDHPAPLFENLTARIGMQGVPAKDCIVADIDGDGF